MVFLCEYETQGIAYQEALASNVPILAWDPGYCLDPHWEIFEGAPMPATSTPYFSAQCGERFRMIKEFEDAFDHFWTNLHQYEPRKYVMNNLSLAGSANLFMSYYSAMRATASAYLESQPTDGI